MGRKSLFAHTCIFQHNPNLLPKDRLQRLSRISILRLTRRPRPNRTLHLRSFRIRRVPKNLEEIWVRDGVVGAGAVDGEAGAACGDDCVRLSWKWKGEGMISSVASEIGDK